MTLQDAINLIEIKHFEKVVKIEFEDGSGHKFNYRLKGESKDRFINIKEKFADVNEFVKQFMEAKKIMDKW